MRGAVKGALDQGCGCHFTGACQVAIVMRDNIKGFNGVRGLAVLSVVLTHLSVWKYLEDEGYISASVTPLVHGSTAVEAFFVLSGFLITRLLITEQMATGRVSIKNFMIRRTLRIAPLYCAFLLLASLLHLAGNHVATWASLRYAYFYCYNFIPYNLGTGFLEHTWSLAVEEHFYLIWPSVFVVLFQRDRRLVISLLSLSILGSLLLHYAFAQSHYSAEYWVSRWTFISGYNLAAGCLVAILIHSGDRPAFFSAILKAPVSLLAGLLLYTNSLYLHSGDGFVDNVVSEYLRTAGITLGIAWLFLNQESLMAKVLEYPPLKYVGLISYGIYMYQGLFLSTGPQRDPSSDWPPDQSVGMVLLVITAPLSYYFFERPFLQLKHRYSHRSSSGAGDQRVEMHA